MSRPFLYEPQPFDRGFHATSAERAAEIAASGFDETDFDGENGVPFYREKVLAFREAAEMADDFAVVYAGFPETRADLFGIIVVKPELISQIAIAKIIYYENRCRKNAHDYKPLKQLNEKTEITGVWTPTG